MNADTLIVLVVLIVLGLLFILLFRHLKKQRIEWLNDMEELQRREGWVFELRDQSSLGKPAYFQIHDAEGRWTVGRSVMKQANHTKGVRFEFIASHPSACDGTFIYGPTAPHSSSGVPLSGVVMTLFTKMLGLSPEDAAGLQAVDVSSPGTILATPGAEKWMDVEKLTQILLAWKSSFPQERKQPIIILSGKEYRVVLRAALDGGEEIEAFIQSAIKARSTILV